MADYFLGKNLPEMVIDLPKLANLLLRHVNGFKGVLIDFNQVLE